MLTRENIYVICGIVVVLVIFYFIVDHKIKRTVRDELMKIEKRKLKKHRMFEMKQKEIMEQQEQQQQQQQHQQQQQPQNMVAHHESGNDSYMDPLFDVDVAENEEQPRARLTKGGIGMRDLEDGTR